MSITLVTTKNNLSIIQKKPPWNTSKTP